MCFIFLFRQAYDRLAEISFWSYILAMKHSPSFLLFFLLAFPLPSIAQSDSDSAAAALAEQEQQALAHGDTGTARIDYEKMAKLEPDVTEVHATLAAIDFQQLPSNRYNWRRNSNRGCLG